MSLFQIFPYFFVSLVFVLTFNITLGFLFELCFRYPH